MVLTTAVNSEPPLLLPVLFLPSTTMKISPPFLLSSKRPSAVTDIVRSNVHRKVSAAANWGTIVITSNGSTLNHDMTVTPALTFLPR
jgi:hypothetical protein